MNYNDDQLIDLISENIEEARDVLYEKYKYIVDIIINKYHNSAYYLSVDMNDLKQEALVGFSDALASYNPDSSSSLPTFISLCVERRVNNYIKKNETKKMKLLKETVSLDDKYNKGTDDEYTLMDLIPDNSNNPEDQIIEKENITLLRKKINELLSPTELEIYELLVNDFTYEDIAKITNKRVGTVYNIVYRIRNKIKDIL